MVFVVMSIQHVAYWNCLSESQMSEGGGQGGAKNHPNDLKLTWRCSQFLFEKTETFTMKTLMIGSMSNSHHKPWLNVSGSHNSYFNSYIEISHSRIGWPHLVKKKEQCFLFEQFFELQVSMVTILENQIICAWPKCHWMSLDAFFSILNAFFSIVLCSSCSMFSLLSTFFWTVRNGSCNLSGAWTTSSMPSSFRCDKNLAQKGKKDSSDHRNVGQRWNMRDPGWAFFCLCLSGLNWDWERERRLIRPPKCGTTLKYAWSRMGLFYLSGLRCCKVPGLVCPSTMLHCLSNEGFYSPSMTHDGLSLLMHYMVVLYPFFRICLVSGRMVKQVNRNKWPTRWNMR